MSKKLAIKGHPTRGKEVIELLEMIGGNNRWGASGVLPNLYYFISNKCIIYSSQIEKDVVIFTLEEFWKKYPFKVGDKVYIKVDPNENCLGYDKIYGEIESAMWVEKFGYVVYELKDSIGIFYREDLHACKEEESMEDNKLFGTLSNPIETKSYTVCLKDGEVIDNLEKTSVKNHKMGPKSKLPSKYYEEIQTKRDMDETMFMIGPVMVPDIVNNNLEYNIIDGYEFDKVENNKIILKPIKPQYPKTYKECCEKINACPTVDISYNSNEDMLYNDEVDLTLLALRKLLICRDAYWKIAGEKMGLGKPWEPDWNHINRKFYCIYNSKNNIVKNVLYTENKILAFPTEEVRDTFYEYFKDLIEQCKKFL